MDQTTKQNDSGTLISLGARGALRAKGLGAWHVRNGNRLDVFSGVNIDVSPGHILGLFGANGTGKSTLVRTLAGLHRDFEGTVDFPLLPFATSRAALSYVPQSYQKSFFPWANLETNILITFPHPIRDRSCNRQLVRNTCATLGIDLDLSLPSGQCSGGMLQQAALARALCQSPSVVLADEPFSALDYAVAGRVRTGFVRAVKEAGSCAVIVLHRLEDILEVCDSVLMIKGGPFTSEDDRGGFLPVERVSNSTLKDVPRTNIADRNASSCSLLKQVLNAGGRK